MLKLLTPRLLLNLTLFLSLIFGIFSFFLFEKNRFESDLRRELINNIEMFQTKHLQSYLNFIGDASVLSLITLNTDHTHIIKKKLQTLTQNQKIDGIRLVNKNCEAISEFGSYGDINICQKISSISVMEPKKFYWQSSDSAFALYFMTNFPDSVHASYFISYEKIDIESFVSASKWLHQLHKQGFNLGFLFDQNRQLDTNIKNPKDFFSHNNMFKNMILVFKNSPLKKVYWIFILCLALIFVIGQATYLGQLKKLNFKIKNRKKFLDDVNNMINLHKIAVDNNSSSSKSPFNEEALRLCHLALTEISNENIKIKEENFALQLASTKIKEENIKLIKKNSENLSFDLNRPRVLVQDDRIKFLQNNLTNFIQKTQTIEADFGNYLTNLNSIFLFIHTGIENRKNAKGFFRALAETPANNLKNTNLLEEVLESLQRNFKGIDQIFYKIKDQNKETTILKEELNKLALQFRQFIESTSPNFLITDTLKYNEVNSLAHSILDLQTELFDDGLINIEFKNKFDPEDTSLNIKFNHAVLKAVYGYFCYFLGRENATSTSKNILETTIKVTSGIGRVVLMYSWGNDSKTPNLSTISQNFIDSCKQQGLTISFLPNKNRIAIVFRLELSIKEENKELHTTEPKDNFTYDSAFNGLN